MFQIAYVALALPVGLHKTRPFPIQHQCKEFVAHCGEPKRMADLPGKFLTPAQSQPQHGSKHKGYKKGKQGRSSVPLPNLGQSGACLKRPTPTKTTGANRVGQSGGLKIPINRAMTSMAKKMAEPALAQVQHSLPCIEATISPSLLRSKPDTSRRGRY